eukprot:COSAG01_NODE_47871_length_386_cov_0.815331_1_plen_40_part_01
MSTGELQATLSAQGLLLHSVVVEGDNEGAGDDDDAGDAGD